MLSQTALRVFTRLPDAALDVAKINDGDLAILADPTKGMLEKYADKIGPYQTEWAFLIAFGAVTANKIVQVQAVLATIATNPGAAPAANLPTVQ